MNTERSINRNNTVREINRRGLNTTEYEAAKSGALWSVIAFLLGIIGAFGSTIAAAFGADSTGGMVVGALITISGLAAKVLIELGYIKARENVKVAAAQAIAAEAISDNAAANTAPALTPAPAAAQSESPVPGATML